MWNPGRRRAAGLCLILLAPAAWCGCGPGPAAVEPEGVKVGVVVSPDPPAVGRASVIVSLSDDGGAPIRGAAVRVEGNMNHAGMRPEFGDGREVEPGRYEVPLEFTMGGDWFLLVEARLADGRSLREQVDVPAVRSR